MWRQRFEAGVMVLILVLSTACGESNQDAAGATVKGTLTLPGMASGKRFFVRIVSGLTGPTIGEQTGTTNGTSTLSYSIGGVVAGTYFLLGVVDVDSSGGTSSTTGDYRGWYGHTGDGNPPATANVVVPSSGTSHSISRWCWPRSPRGAVT